MSEGDSTQTVLSISPKKIFKPFAQQVTIKLDEDNFSFLEATDRRYAHTHKLHRYLVDPVIPPHYLTEDDHNSDIENPAYHVGTTGFASLDVTSHKVVQRRASSRR